MKRFLFEISKPFLVGVFWPLAHIVLAVKFAGFCAMRLIQGFSPRSNTLAATLALVVLVGVSLRVGLTLEPQEVSMQGFALFYAIAGLLATIVTASTLLYRKSLRQNPGQQPRRNPFAEPFMFFFCLLSGGSVVTIRVAIDLFMTHLG